MQPCTAHSGGNDSVAKLATLLSSEHGDGLGPKTKTAAAAKHLQPGTARSGGNASVEVGDARIKRARRRPTRADNEGSGCSKALAALHRAQRWERQRNDAGGARVERARRRPTRADDEGSGCSKALAALHRAQRWKRQLNKAGDAR
eukprot:scaffold40111_cov47-Phaeocystis_antarctica.AAC.2